MIQKFLESRLSGYLSIIAVLALTSVLIGGYLYIHHQGYKACEQDAIVKQAASNDKAIESRKEIEHESKNLNREQLIDDLRNAGELRDEADL